MCNYRHPGFGRGEPRVLAAGRAPFCANPAHPLHPLDPVSNTARLQNAVKRNDVAHFFGKWGPVGSPRLGMTPYSIEMKQKCIC